MPRIAFTVDGERREIDADADMPLLYALRGELALKGPKFGCGLAQCGACTVIVDGAATRSCVIPIAAVQDSEIRTLDRLGTAEHPHPVQAAFIAEEAAQCGYCTNGWIMTAVAGLERNPRPSDAEIRAMLAGLKCRCGAHMSMLRAVRRAADRMASAENADESTG
jgi:aerobic-type carbon monoxide dehydrogenase small subunit (CoxS/CutS family)